MNKHDVLAHIWQFIGYVEDRMAAPKLFDKDVMRIKLEQIKEVLTNADPAEESERGSHPKQKGRGKPDSKDKGMARTRLKR